MTKHCKHTRNHRLVDVQYLCDVNVLYKRTDAILYDLSLLQRTVAGSGDAIRYAAVRFVKNNIGRRVRPEAAGTE